MDSFLVNWYRSLKKDRAEKHAARVAANIVCLTDLYKNWLTNSGDASMIGWAISKKVDKLHYISEEEKEAVATTVIEKMAENIKISIHSGTYDRIRSML